MKKKTLALIMAAAMVMGLAACGSSNSTATTEDTTTEAAETEAAETTATEETVEAPAADASAETAPQTFDMGIIAAAAAVVSLAGYAVAKKH